MLVTAESTTLTPETIHSRYFQQLRRRAERQFDRANVIELSSQIVKSRLYTLRYIDFSAKSKVKQATPKQRPFQPGDSLNVP